MKRKGFTLIELLVVIAIIGILATIGLVALNGAREKARDATRKSDISQIKTALVLYSDDYGSAFPGGDFAGLDAALVTAYLSKLPHDPQSATNGGTHADYAYESCTVSQRSTFLLYAQLESPNSTDNFFYFYVAGNGDSGDKVSGATMGACADH
ncbi:MAG: type II secretion system protein [Patescibacteria group bacterium]